ncbi:SdrD B-like domain-containing protein [Moorellaceae bacterium AZ2]
MNNGSKASNSLLTVRVKEAGTGLPIPNFKFIVNEDNVGNPLDPDPANWPSLRAGPSHSPVVATGDHSNPTVRVPDGKYLVSVLAPGHKMGGNWITVNGDTEVTVELVSHPLPLSKIRVHVFHDNQPVNGELDIPVEAGLAGFRIVIHDTVGEVQVDYFGNPLGTLYRRDQQGNFLLDAEGNPIPVPGTGGVILTDANGDAVIENLPPGKYAVQAIPPDGTDWIQTTTIEGTPVIDAWIEEGNDGYSAEEGFRLPLVWIGFVRPMDWGEVKEPGTGTIRGTIRSILEGQPQGPPVDRPWIALTDIGGNDQQVWTGRGNPDGTFVINNVPAGVYQMAIWDEPLDHIISFRTVRISGGALVDMGDIHIPRWFGRIEGAVFRDANENGIRDPGEEGIPNVEVGTRFKDGSIQYRTVTDMDGNYSLEEVFELERFAVAQVAFTRWGQTVAAAVPHPGLPFPPAIVPGGLTIAEMTGAGMTTRIDWGKKEYPLADGTSNGGISGMVYYATMRNEIDPRYAAAEDYEPGIPKVTINLYTTTVDQNGNLVQGAKINSVTTGAWEHPKRPDGTIVTEVPLNSGYVAPGVYDGGFSFTTYFEPYYGAPNAVEKPLPAGTYIVEVVPPEGYRAVDENSVNTDQGDEYVIARNASVQKKGKPNTGRAGAEQVSINVVPPGYYGDSRTKKVVTLQNGQNAAVDFFLYTDVPIPGRIVGGMWDDLNLETNPTSPFYREKRGIAHTPVGIRDYQGRLLTTVYTDQYGIFEVLLPSTYTANVPAPSGVAPAMYQVIGNDPGDPERPNANYNPDYQTLKLVFDVWPGKTTYADVALFPVSNLVETPNGDLVPPYDVAPGTPLIYQVDRVYVTLRGIRTIKITGVNFGDTRGQVTLGGKPIWVLTWTDTVIRVRVPLYFSPGPAQLLVRKRDGKVSPTGITIHVLGSTYNPTVVTLTPGTSIQQAIDAADANTLIIVPPGTYYESPILYKNVKLQGMGPKATVIDGRFFASYRQEWLEKINSLDFDGPQNISQGQALTVVAKAGAFNSAFNPQIDGFTITGARGSEAGGILVHAFACYLEISNNVIEGNGGGFGGGITIGKPYAGDLHNELIHIHHNRIIRNGGVSLAGGIGIFNGAHYYNIHHNEIIGNYSAEYGGGLSHFGLSHGGQIHHNRVLFNSSFDEGGGILVGGEQPIPPQTFSAGSGEVDIFNNLIQGNLANDDGGGIRLLQPGTYRIRIYNNIIVNNVSTDLGGGIALDDASNVIICNNTIAKNATTATAEDSDGQPHGAGLVSEAHSAAFQALLPPGSPNFSDPVLFNNIFWDNRAYHFDPVAGKLAEDYLLMDMEVFGTPEPKYFHPYYCSLSTPYGPPHPTNLITDPAFVLEYDTKIRVGTLRGQPDFKSTKIVIPAPGVEGNYHLKPRSPVVNRGTVGLTLNGIYYPAPLTDYDDQPRRRWPGVDIGADEVG